MENLMSRLKRNNPLWLFFGLLLLTSLACRLSDIGQPAGSIPSNAAVVEVVANQSLLPWLEQAAADFNATETKTADGRSAFVVVQGAESGQFVATAEEGALPALWLPDSPVWVSLLADRDMDNFNNACVSVAQSPLVIGVWREAAESLGWPGYALGWLDFGSLAQDPSAWAYYTGGEYGAELRLSHTHPGLSGAGASTLLALVQSAERKTDAVTVEEIQRPLVQASVGAFESAVAFFANNPLNLAQTMQTRGPGFLGAAVMYESDAVSQGQGAIIPIYPLEGTFMATHPACINQFAAESAKEAAGQFRDYLLSEAGQETAVSHALRPVNPAISAGPLLTAENGVDLTQPQTIFAEPSAETVYAIQSVWQEARKDVNLVMLLDTSGSMRGRKMDGMKAAAEQFVQQMGDEDRLTLIAFATEPTLIVEAIQVGPNRDKLVNAIRALNASGDTTLYDAIGDGAASIARTTLPDQTNALIILSDGQDTRSYRYRFGPELIALASGNNTTVFAIAYGSDADENILGQFAFGGNGNLYSGDEASIAAIYEEMSAAFGGSVGVGR